MMNKFEAYQVPTDRQQSPLSHPLDLAAECDFLEVAMLPSRYFPDHVPDVLRSAADSDGADLDGMDADEAAELMSRATGRTFTTYTINGCVQGDWRELIAPEGMNRAELAAFEAEYFNTGEEWIVDDCSVYLHPDECMTDATRAGAIADSLMCDPADIVLHVFTGYACAPCWS